MAKWSLPIDRYVRAAKGDVNKAVRAVALEMFTRILWRSPVDTGRFRGNWMIGLNFAPTEAELTGWSESGGGAVGYSASIKRTGTLADYKLGDQISFRNNLPYAVALEKGWSQQAPAGVVAVTIQEFGAITARQARRIRLGQASGMP